MWLPFPQLQCFDDFCGVCYLLKIVISKCLNLTEVTCDQTLNSAGRRAHCSEDKKRISHCVLDRIFAHPSLSLVPGSEYLLLCHQTIHIMISPIQPLLPQIAVLKQCALQTKSNNEHSRGKQTRWLLQKGKMKRVGILLAFFQGLCKFHFTICSLKLIKKRAGLDFVVYTFPQLRNDNAVFGWSPHFKD